MIPERCDCGGAFSPDHYDYWQPPEIYVCGSCGRTDEQVVEQHTLATCTIDACAWCAFIREEC